MRIVDIRERTVPISSPIANAYIDFTGMTCSVVALVTDVVRNGERVVGYGFNSNGRYGQGGLIRERFAPRILRAAPDSLLDESSTTSIPTRSGRRCSETRSRAATGALGRDRHSGHGGLDAVSKIAGEPLFRLLAERYGNGTAAPGCSCTRPAAITTRGGTRSLTDEMRGYLDRGYTVVKMKIGGAPLKEDLVRIEAVLSLLSDGQNLAVDANGRFDRETAISYAKALRAYDLFWFEEPGDPLDFEMQALLAEHYPAPMATGENLFSMRTPGTSFATEGCGPRGTGSSSTVP